MNQFSGSNDHDAPEGPEGPGGPEARHRACEPLFAEVRRRHPDVDVVLLPPEPPPPSTGPVTDEVVALALTRITGQAERLWAASTVGSPNPPASTPIETVLDYGDDEGSVRARATLAAIVGEPAERGTAVLGALGDVLVSDGWSLRVRESAGSSGSPGSPGSPRSTGSPLTRLDARLGELSLEATLAHSRGVLRLTVASGSLTVGLDRARALVRGGI